ncbi:MAG: beta strand repeat-containing protein, partial [Bacteroidota bacterium]
MNWSDTTKWEVSTDGGASWNTAANYPAQIATDTVSVRTGQIVTLDTTLTNTIDSLEVVGTLRIGNNGSVRTFTVNQLLISGTLSAGNNTATHTVTVNGRWTNNGTWTAVSGTGIVNVVFSGAGNSSIGGNAATQTFNSLSVNKNSSSDTLSVGGSTTALVLSGTMTLSSGVFVAPASITLNTANWTNNGGSFLPNSGTVQFTSAAATAQIINGSAASQTFHRIVVTKGTRTLNTGGSLLTLNIDSSLVLNTGIFAPVGAITINIKGDWTNNGATYTPGTATVVFTKTNGTQSINGTAVSQTLGNITVAKSTDTLLVGGSTTSLTLSAVTLTSGVVLAPATLNVSGNWTNNGAVFVEGTGTVVFNSTTAAQQINGSAALQSFNNFTVSKSGQTLTFAGSMDSLVVKGNLSITAGTLADGGKQIVGDAAKTFSLAAASGLTLGSTTTATVFPKNYVTANVTINATSTVTYNSNIAQTISNIPASYGNLTLTSTAAVVKSLADSILINGTLTINLNNTLNANNFNVRIGGNWTNNAGATGFTAGTDTVFFTSSGVQTITGTTQFAYISIGSTTTFRLATSADVRYNGAVLNSGIFDANTNIATVTVNGPSALPANTKSFQHITIGAGGSFTAPDTLFIKGNWTNNGGSFNQDTSIVYFNSTTAAQVVQGTALTQTFYKIVVQKSAQTLSTGGSLTALNIANDVLLTSGIITPAAGDTVIVYGDWTNNGATFTAGTSIIKFTGSVRDQLINGTATRQTFNTLIIEKSGKQLSFGGSTDTLIVGSVLLTSGTFAAPLQITSGGNWTNNGGTFTSGSGTVSFTNTAAVQIINGTAAAQTFNHIVMAKTAQSLSTAGNLTALNINGNFT